MNVIVYAKKDVYTYHEGAFGNSTAFFKAGGIYVVNREDSSRYVYQWRTEAAPDQDFHKYFYVLAVNGNIGRTEKTFLSSGSWISFFMESDQYKNGRVPMGLEVAVFLRSRYAQTQKNGDFSFSTGGHLQLYVQVDPNGTFDPKTTEGDFVVEGPYGLLGNLSGRLEDVLKIVVQMTETQLCWVSGGSYADVRAQVAEVVKQNKWLKFGGRPFKVVAENFGKNVLIDDQARPTHQLANSQYGFIPVTWGEAVAANWTFWSNGEKVWVEQPEIKLTVHTQDWRNEEGHLLAAGIYGGKTWCSLEKIQTVIDDYAKRKLRVVVETDGIEEVVGNGPISNTIETTQYQTWQRVALLKGLGFAYQRTNSGDVFTPSLGEVECIFDGWESSKDGSRLSNWDELSDPDSPHYGRRYLTAFMFLSPEGCENVIVWESSPHSSGQLYRPIGLGSLADWKRSVEDEPERFGLGHWLQFNGVSL